MSIELVTIDGVSLGKIILPYILGNAYGTKMSETILVSIIGFLATITGIVVSYALGKKSERKLQLFQVRTKQLIPIEEWLQGAERFNGILGDTVGSVSINSTTPLIYSIDDRRRAVIFMGEKTNVVLGIIKSKTFQKGYLKKHSDPLSANIIKIDVIIKRDLLPLDDEILEQSNTRGNRNDLTQKAISVKEQLDALIQDSYSLIATIKSTLS